MEGNYPWNRQWKRHHPALYLNVQAQIPDPPVVTEDEFKHSNVSQHQARKQGSLHAAYRFVAQKAGGEDDFTQVLVREYVDQPQPQQVKSLAWARVAAAIAVTCTFVVADVVVAEEPPAGRGYQESVRRLATTEHAAYMPAWRLHVADDPPAIPQSRGFISDPTYPKSKAGALRAVPGKAGGNDVLQPAELPVGRGFISAPQFAKRYTREHRFGAAALPQSALLQSTDALLLLNSTAQIFTGELPQFAFISQPDPRWSRIINRRHAAYRFVAIHAGGQDFVIGPDDLLPRKPTLFAPERHRRTNLHAAYRWMTIKAGGTDVAAPVVISPVVGRGFQSLPYPFAALAKARRGTAAYYLRPGDIKAVDYDRPAAFGQQVYPDRVRRRTAANPSFVIQTRLLPASTVFGQSTATLAIQGSATLTTILDSRTATLVITTNTPTLQTAVQVNGTGTLAINTQAALTLQTTFQSLTSSLVVTDTGALTATITPASAVSLTLDGTGVLTTAIQLVTDNLVDVTLLELLTSAAPLNNPVLQGAASLTLDGTSTVQVAIQMSALSPTVALVVSDAGVLTTDIPVAGAASLTLDTAAPITTAITMQAPLNALVLTVADAPFTTATEVRSFDSALTLNASAFVQQGLANLTLSTNAIFTVAINQQGNISLTVNSTGTLTTAVQLQGAATLAVNTLAAVFDLRGDVVISVFDTQAVLTTGEVEPPSSTRIIQRATKKVLGQDAPQAVECPPSDPTVAEVVPDVTEPEADKCPDPTFEG